MLITYQYKLNPTTEQTATMEVWGELLRRHYNYALGQRLDWLHRTRCQIDRDWNSGINILNRVQRTLGLAFAGCGGYLGASPMRQQLSIALAQRCVAQLGSPFYTAQSG